MVVQVAENVLESNGTVAEVEAKLDDLCNNFPAPYSGECALIVNSYLPQIVQWIDNNEPPATLCGQLSLCPTAKAPKQVKKPAKREVEQTPCAVCEMIVQVVETYVDNNATLSQIEAKLDGLCGDLPSPYNGECTLIVNSYLPQIVAWLQNDEPPATVCAQLSLCSSKKKGGVTLH
jgi:saposin